MAGQRKALIIANDTYEQEALRDLLAPAADAEALGRVLGDPQIGDFAVQVVHNEPAHVIEAQIEEVFVESRPDDVLLLHFSGHGLKSESGELFFAASNTRPNRLGSTAVSADFVQRCMRDSRSRSVILLLDCCYGGAFAQGVKVRAAGDVNVLDSFPQGRSGGGRGRAVITASSAMEFAFEGDQLGDDQYRRPSVFTTALVEGLATGEADRDEDGWVSLDELYDYVFDKVREQNPHQTPSRQFELEGELYLARSRRQRIRTAPIPPDLRTALADPNMYTRLGAVSELRSRLVSDNLPAAAGAYAALAELASTDISYVADAASAAVVEARVQPGRTELHFGRIEQGSAPPRKSVQLLGPPIARACIPRPSHDWIRVNEMAGRLDISIDTTGLGTLRGGLSLKGPTGEAVIAIDVDLVVPAPRTPPVPSQDKPRSTWPYAPTTEVGRPEGSPAAQGRARQQAPNQPAKAPYSKRAPTVGAPLATPHHTRRPPVLSTQQPAIRNGAAFAGLSVGLLAGILGLVSHHFQYPAPVSGVFIFFEQAFYVVPVAVVFAALALRNYRPAMFAFLQGLWWPSAAWLICDLVIATQREYLTPSSVIAGNYFAAGADALGVVAAVFLLASRKPGASGSQAGRSNTLPVMLVCFVTLSQVTGLILYQSPAAFGQAAHPLLTQGVPAVVVGLAISWYAVSLRAPTQGGALLLGWVTTTSIWLISTVLYVYKQENDSLTTAPRVSAILEFILLAIVLILAVIYMREPSGGTDALEE